MVVTMAVTMMVINKGVDNEKDDDNECNKTMAKSFTGGQKQFQYPIEILLGLKREVQLQPDIQFVFREAEKCDNRSVKV